MRKILLAILLVLLIILMLYKSPFSGAYYYNKAKNLYLSGKYEESLPVFERSLFGNPKSLLTRFYYVLALSKSKPTYSVQKKLYEMGNSNIDDEAKKYARYQAVSLRYKLLEGLENNYIDNAAEGNDIVRWDIQSFPLKVYFENSDSVPVYYKANVDKALQQWTNRTNFVKFTEVSNKKDANIIIKFIDLPKDICSGGVCRYTVAYTEPVVSNDGVLTGMNLTFYKTNPRNKLFSELEIYNTALHELGHTLGIMGHSNDVQDIMFASNEHNTMYSMHKLDFQYLSKSDINTLVLLYRLAPTISNVKNLSSESFYYPPLIMGSNDARLQKKLQELKQYIINYPNFASGYINISSVYVDLGDFDSALEALDRAESLVKNDDERYLVTYNKAIVYYNSQDLDSALKYANKAKAIKSNQNVIDLISDINNLK